MYDKNTFIKRLIELRNDFNLSQEKLAKLIGVTDACVNRWEKGLRTPKAESIFELCKALNCSADYLLGLKDDE